MFYIENDGEISDAAEHSHPFDYKYDFLFDGNSSVYSTSHCLREIKLVINKWEQIFCICVKLIILIYSYAYIDNERWSDGLDMSLINPV